ncbi:MAG: fatty acid--CoA ligase, partial [Gammaproteobacteria bacterium]|nr:fatty acid--CoA ligase [Gammaproteobacteria bacterium]
LKHPDVAEVAVIATADERWQERPLAIVVARPGRAPAAQELRTFLGDRVARFWIPEYWCFTGSIAKTGIGKTDKKALRDSNAAGALTVEVCK